MANLSRKEVQKYTKFAHSLYSDVIGVSVSLSDSDDKTVILRITRGCTVPDLELDRDAELPDCIKK